MDTRLATAGTSRKGSTHDHNRRYTIRRPCRRCGNPRHDAARGGRALRRAFPQRGRPRVPPIRGGRPQFRTGAPVLVITVKDSQSFALLRDGVELGTLQVSIRKDGKARVAFDFPRDVEIWRGEIAEQRKAAANDA